MLELSILTPGRVAVSESVASISAPSVDGQFRILPRHCPLITCFQKGICTYQSSSSRPQKLCEIQDGFIKVQGKRVTVLCRSCLSKDAS